MSAPLASAVDKAAALRLAFDQAFAQPVQVDTAPREALLAVRVGAAMFGIRLAEISGLHADRKITAVPGGAAALLGIAGFRGNILPVYRLQVLLEGAVPADAGAPRWLVIAAAAPVAFAFEGFDGQRRVRHEAIFPRPAEDVRTFAREFARSRKFVGPILHLPSILDAIETE